MLKSSALPTQKLRVYCVPGVVATSWYSALAPVLPEPVRSMDTTPCWALKTRGLSVYAVCTALSEVPAPMIHADPATSGVAPYRLYNIGNEQPVELLRYIEVLEHCLGRKAIMELLPLQPGDVPDTEADVSELIAGVGYRPVVSVEEGIGDFVRWYRGYFDGDR